MKKMLCTIVSIGLAVATVSAVAQTPKPTGQTATTPDRFEGLTTTQKSNLQLAKPCDLSLQKSPEPAVVEVNSKRELRVIIKKEGTGPCLSCELFLNVQYTCLIGESPAVSMTTPPQRVEAYVSSTSPLHIISNIPIADETLEKCISKIVTAKVTLEISKDCPKDENTANNTLTTIINKRR